MHLEVVLEGVWRYSSRVRLSNSEMHLEAVIERVWRCTLRLRSCNSEMRFESVIVPVWRCTSTPSLLDIGGELGGGRSEAVDREGGATAAETLFIG
jgi:hypothetical protein